MLDKILRQIVILIWKLFILLIKVPYKVFKNGVKKKTKPDFKKHTKEWEEISKLIQSDNVHELKSALVLADKSLDNVMKELSFDGETMGDRLIKGKDKFKAQTYNEIWSAHKVRNSMVHETGYNPSASVFKDAIFSLKKGIRELGVPL
jgi:hypothetical protein